MKQNPLVPKSNWTRSILFFLTFLLWVPASSWGQSLFKYELGLPARGLSQRVTLKDRLEPGEKRVLFDETGPGCILHWWMAYPRSKQENQEYERIHYIRIRIYYDDHTEPDLDVTLGQFFSILQKRDLYNINNAAIKVVPLTALNCYFPIPFEKCRIEMENTASFRNAYWIMFDWHQYQDHDITPIVSGLPMPRRPLLTQREVS
jgi:hypothetical protein